MHLNKRDITHVIAFVLDIDEQKLRAAEKGSAMP